MLINSLYFYAVKFRVITNEVNTSIDYTQDIEYNPADWDDLIPAMYTCSVNL